MLKRTTDYVTEGFQSITSLVLGEPQKELEFVSQGDYDKLCWAACALMLQKYLNIPTPSSDPLITIAKKVIPPKPFGHSVVSKKGFESEEFKYDEYYNKPLDVKDLQKIYRELLDIDLVYRGPAFSQYELEKKMLEEKVGPILVYYGERANGHLAIIAKAETDPWEGQTGYYLYDPQESSAPTTPKSHRQLGTWEGFQWGTSFWGCKRCGLG